MRYYVLVRLKDLSHIEAEFDTTDEIREFLEKHKSNMLPHETIIEDRKKYRDARNNEILGWILMAIIGLFVLYHMLN